eukprot:5196064-Lingulodinium_polyedra.AAC.1
MHGCLDPFLILQDVHVTAQDVREGLHGMQVQRLSSLIAFTRLRIDAAQVEGMLHKLDASSLCLACSHSDRKATGCPASGSTQDGVRALHNPAKADGPLQPIDARRPPVRPLIHNLSHASAVRVPALHEHDCEAAHTTKGSASIATAHNSTKNTGRWQNFDASQNSLTALCAASKYCVGSAFHNGLMSTSARAWPSRG